jgi:carbonic anhydrase/acetyltransferase-like protein (isoleucine patch superfamily)
VPSSNPLLIELDGVRPTIGRDVFIAPTAVLIGDVRVADRANIWFGAVLRGDFSYIEIGEGSSIQDNSVVHCADDLPTVVGRDVIVGHGSILEGCVVEDGALVGMGSILCQRSRLGAGAMLAAGSVLSERGEVARGMLAAGVPAREKKELSGSAKGWTEHAAAEYQQLRRRYIDNLEEASATDADWRRAASGSR